MVSRGGNLASWCQEAPAGFDKHLCPRDDIGVFGVFVPVMADTADRGHEQHPGRHDRGEDLGIVTGTAWHAHRSAPGKHGARLFDGVLESGVHDGGRAGAKPTYFNGAAGSCRNFAGGVSQQPFDIPDHFGTVVPDLEKHFGASRDDAWRARIKGDAAGGPYRAWTARVREALIELDT